MYGDKIKEGNAKSQDDMFVDASFELVQL